MDSTVCVYLWFYVEKKAPSNPGNLVGSGTEGLLGSCMSLGPFLFHVSGLPFTMQENSIVRGIEKTVKGKRMKRETPHINIANFPASEKSLC